MHLLQKIFKQEKTISIKTDRIVILYIFVILLACIKQLYGVRYHLDLPFFDESDYLKKGFFLGKQAFNDWGPSYNLWYYLISKLSNNAVQTFYLNYSILIILIPILNFILLIRLEINKNLALILTLLFLMQPMLSVNFTFVSHFCLIIILTAFILITYQKENQSKIIIAFTAAYICMYARQEFLLIAASILLVYFVAIFFDKKIKWSFALVGVCLTILILYFIFGFISFKALGIDRSYFAFIQHFYINYSIWTKKLLPIEQFIALDIFHGSKTMFQCLLSEPLIFMKHMSTNFLNYLVSLYKYLENFILPQSIFHYLGKFKHLLFLILIIYFVYLIVKKKSYKNLINNIRNFTISNLLTLLFFSWSFFSIFFIFPERHYIILQFIWWIYLIAVILNNHINWLENKIVFIIILIIVLLFVPTSKSINYFHTSILDAKKQPFLKTINYLKKNNDHKSHIIFSSEKGFNTYLPKNYQEQFLEMDSIIPYRKNGILNIEKYLSDKNISIIFMNEKMQILIQENLGETGKIILNTPEKIGFRKEIIDQNLQTYILTKEN